MESSDLKPNEAELLDSRIVNLEMELQRNSNNFEALYLLLYTLDFYVPNGSPPGRYTACQQALLEKEKVDNLPSLLTGGEVVAEIYKRWQALLHEFNVQPNFQMQQLAMGADHKIHGESTRCDLRLKLFNENKVISKLCHSCFKVQILTTNLTGLMVMYFTLRRLDLPRDNTRKCMIEMRENVPNPYKGYIYCQTEREAAEIAVQIDGALREHGNTHFISAITHGCSEFGLEYPAFKYSQDGSHNKFKRLGSWDRIERDNIGKISPNKAIRRNHNKGYISILDVLGFRTWIDYAQIIDDKNYLNFRDSPRLKISPQFEKHLKPLAKLRQKEIKLLDTRIERSQSP